MHKRYHESVQKWATEEEVSGCRLFGQPLMSYTKEEIAKVFIYFQKKNEENKHDDNILRKIRQSLISLKEAK